MNLRYNTMNFVVLYNEQFAWYKSTKYRSIIPHFFLRVYQNISILLSLRRVRSNFFSACMSSEREKL